MYTSGADQRRTFDSNFNNGNHLERRDESGNFTPEGAKLVVTNQPFIPSFCIDMNNVDWKRTESSGPGNKGYTDLVMNDIKTLLYLPEDDIVHQGQLGVNLYFIAQGDCEVWVKDNKGCTQ